MKIVASLRQPSSTTANGALGAFDPTPPQDGALIIAGVLRDQFNALFDLIQWLKFNELILAARR